MRKLYTFILSAILITMFSISVFACTPNLDLDVWGDLTPPSQITYEPSDEIDKACDNAAKSWLKEHPIDLPKETETEAVETESPQSFDWKSYVPESLYNYWKYFMRR